MKTTKLVLGIISMVLSGFVIFQSCAAGVGNALSANGEASGTFGVLTAMCLLIAGIVGLATRNSSNKGGGIATGIIYLLGAVIGVVGAGSYSDLKIWGIISFVFGLFYFVDILIIKRKSKK